MKKYRLGIIGPGAFGQFCLKAYHAMPEIEIAGIAGKDSAELAKIAHRFGITSWTTNYKLILLRPDIDVVAMFLPPYLHMQMALEAAKAHKPFLCEKPLALTLSEAERILAAVKKYKIPATINYVMRYTSIYQQVIEIAREKRFGKIKRLLFENYASCEGLGPKHWIWDEAKSGGLLVEHGVHFFDIFARIIDQKPLAVKGLIPSANEAFAIVHYPHHVLATFYHLFDKTTVSERNYARIVFERGYAEIKGWLPIQLKIEWQDNDGRMHKTTKEIEGDKDDYYQKLVQEVMRDLLKKIDDPSHKQKVTLEDGRDSLALALMSKRNKLF